MRIGVYDPYLDDLGGGEKYMLKICECLSEQHDVEIFWDEEKILEKAESRFNLNLARVKVTRNIFLNKFFSKVFQTKKYDILIILSDGSIPLSFAKKTYLHIQQPLKNIKPGFKEKLKMKKISGIFCNSLYTKSFLDKDLGSITKVVYPPVDLRPKQVKKENIILHVGRFRVKEVVTGIADYKKQFVMVEAFKEMVDKGFSNWRFVLGVSIREGEESKFNQLKEKAKGYPIEFLINKSNDQLWDIYSKAKIYWHASGYGEDLEASPELAEHFGISTVEAMGAGAVPVVINAGGQKEIVTDNENGYLWNDLGELKDKTTKLANDPKLLERLSIGSKKRAEFFAGERFCKEIKNLILE